MIRMLRMRGIIATVVVAVVGVFAPASSLAQTQPEEQPFVRSRSQKGVETSTDVIAIALPVAALTGVLVQQDWKGLLQGVETAAVTTAATLILKYSIKEWRPDRHDTHSFPSGHTSMSFATAAFVQRRYGWKFGAPAYALATYVGWGRVFSKKHHWWDVVAGAAIGAGSAYIFTRPFAKKHDLQIAPVSDGRNVGVYCSMAF